MLICVFLTGAFFQLNFPLFKKPETPVEYNSATLTAHEKWQIEQDTCESMRKIYGFIENETVSPEEVLALARVEQKVTAQVLKTWNDHAEGKKLSDDWYANATEVWASIIDITESYPYRNSSYCPIYADFKKLNFNRPELAAVWAQNNLRTVNQLGQKSNSYTQLESSMSGLLSNFTDVQLTMPNQQQVDAFLDRAPLQILTNRLDLLCGA